MKRQNYDRELPVHPAGQLLGRASAFSLHPLPSARFDSSISDKAPCPMKAGLFGVQAAMLQPDNAPHSVQEFPCHAKFQIEFSHVEPFSGRPRFRKSTRNQVEKSFDNRQNCDVSPSRMVEKHLKIMILRKRRPTARGIKERVASILAKESYRHRFIS